MNVRRLMNPSRLFALTMVPAAVVLAACGGAGGSPAETESDGGSDGSGVGPSHADAGSRDATTGVDGAPLDATATDGAHADGPPVGLPDAPQFIGNACDAGTFACGVRCILPGASQCGCNNDCTKLPNVSPSGVTCVVDSTAFDASVCDTTGACLPGFLNCSGDSTRGCESDLSKSGNCGSCGTTCGAPYACGPLDGGGFGCVLDCGAGLTVCEQSCVNLASDPAHCGTCAHVCSDAVADASATCAIVADAAVCGFKCALGFTEYDGGCVDTEHDPRNCGAPGNICLGPLGSTTLCAPTGADAGACSFVCNDAALEACGSGVTGKCVDITDDPNNCNGCGNVCSTQVANAVPVCSPNGDAGVCAFACDPGYLACGNAAACVAFPKSPLLDSAGIFVSPAGLDTGVGRGTAAAPYRTVGAALSAAGPASTVYVAAGTYAEAKSVALPRGGVTIVGGWTTSWAPICTVPDGGAPALDRTQVVLAPANAGTPTFAAVTTDGGVSLLESLSINNLVVVPLAAPPVTNPPTPRVGQSLFGVLAQAGALTMMDVGILVGSAGSGDNGTTGQVVDAGYNCTPPTGAVGSPGSAGSTPNNGTGGGIGLFTASGFAASSGSPGRPGGPGSSGGPGGPGASVSSGGGTTVYTSCTEHDDQAGNFVGCDSQIGTASAPSGTAGCGGGGGAPGGAGGAGGSSVGVFSALGATVVVNGGSIVVGNGGGGGSGASGGLGGAGQSGAPGGPGAYVSSCAFVTTPYAQCQTKTKTIAGGALAGGTGGPGGGGSWGGGGSGGDSYGTYQMADGGVVLHGGAPIVGSAGDAGVGPCTNPTVSFGCLSWAGVGQPGVAKAVGP